MASMAPVSVNRAPAQMSEGFIMATRPTATIGHREHDRRDRERRASRGRSLALGMTPFVPWSVALLVGTRVSM